MALLHHSDRSIQYSSGSYQTLLAQADIAVSMSGKGDGYDNAAMESFFSSLKDEWTDWHTYQTRQEAQLSILSTSKCSTIASTAIQLWAIGAQ